MNPLQAHDHGFLSGVNHLVGIDEAGRGCLAGPVMAAACCIDQNFFRDSISLEKSSLINDSKKLDFAAREALYQCLMDLSGDNRIRLAVAEASVVEIARLNILGATRLAMQRAVEALPPHGKDWHLPAVESEGPLFQASPEICLLVDGLPLRPFPYAHQALVKGDGKSLAIAAASIAAKVVRDRRMRALGERFPQYGFEQHKGYATTAHRESIRTHGPCPEHRSLFLRKILSSQA